MNDHDRHECDRRSGCEGGRGGGGGAAGAGACVDGRQAEEGIEVDYRKKDVEEGREEASEDREGESAEEGIEASDEEGQGRGADGGQGTEAEQGEGACDGQAEADVHAYGAVHRDSDPTAAGDTRRHRCGPRGKRDRNSGGVGSADDQSEAGDFVEGLGLDLVRISGVLHGDLRWCVVHGDCLQILPFLPARSVDHVVTDPPYEAEAHTLQRHVRGGRACKVEPLTFEPITDEDRASVGDQFGRLARRWSLVFCQIEALQAWRLAFEHGEMARYTRSCIWDKPDSTPQLSGDRPGTGYEAILAMHAVGRSRWNGGGKRGVFTHSTKEFVNRDGIGGRLHPSQKPITLMLELVQLFTDPGELVIDPYCGSGTTGAACVRTGRRFIGIEKDAAWARTATERLEAESRDQGLAEYRSGQTTIFDKVKS